MNKKKMLLGLAVCILAIGCNDETREGKLNLSGTTPVRIVDEGGKTVEFVSGAVKVEFGAHSGNTFSVSMEQAGKKAKFSGKVPESSDWNFTLHGKQIGQLVDLTSLRKVQLYGEKHTQIGTGGSCGMNGRTVTEETWQNGNEDWTVAFNDASNGQSIGNFASRREGQSYLVDSRDLYCRERPEHDRPGPRSIVSTPTSTAVKNLSTQVAAGVKFD